MITSLIIVAPNSQKKFRTPNTNSILNTYQLVLKISLEKLSSQKIKFSVIRPTVPKKKPSLRQMDTNLGCVIHFVKSLKAISLVPGYGIIKLVKFDLFFGIAF